ncbi:cysteine--tRNA ligase CPS1, chloroplastic/mitochondrial-like [Triticum urartu]|uniref:cysteine--tRNA ligase n=1 Tax=Triticum urartu TaxID=4572 RepID=A0A8R7U9F4_TRIUA|nr:cysteine--tRNA ligase CPS1, chloroplastic/mitochondrial-like [Triticum urartu]
MAENTPEPAATLLSSLTVAEDATATPAATAPPSAPTTAVVGTASPPPLQLFNSMTKKKEPFVPRVEGKVGMYVCGVTPYDFSHVGHARAYVAFDVLYRYLKFLGYEVEYVRNFTDIDDKIIKRANQNGETVTDLSSRFIAEFLADVTELQCLPPTHEPRVTEHIDNIIDLIKEIIKNDKAYVVDGDVYFSVDNFPEYLSLSGRILDHNRAGSRVAVDTRKRNPADFALWKAAKEGEPSWESPWGDGRPGWHIECSAMSAHYLGHVFDIHGGGKDLIFPHHENELAQSRAAYPESEVKCWMHNGFINIDDQKMSKSVNNFFTIRDIITLYHPLALRFFLMRTHYKSDANHSDKALEIASDRVYYIYQTLYDCDEVVSLHREENISVPVPAEEQKLIDDHNKAFLESMSDDLRTTDVLDGFMELLKAINGNLNDLKKLQQKLEQQKKKQQQQKKQQQKQQRPQKQPENHIQALNALGAEIKHKLSILGLMPPSPLAEVLKQLKDKALKRAGLTEESLSEQIEKRIAARNNKQFDVSDQIRKELAGKGIALMDEPTGTVWRPCERE